MPLSVAGANLVAGLIIIFWFIIKGLKNRIKEIFKNKVALASISFFMIHVIGLLWTVNIEWGMEIIRKMLEFGLLLPVLLTITKQANYHQYVNSFLIAIFIMVITSYLISFGFISPNIFRGSTIENPTSFMSQISYSPFLAFASYFIGQRLLDSFKKKYYSPSFLFNLFFFSIVITNLFIVGGRTGQAGFFLLLIVFIYQNFGINLKTFFLAKILTIAVFSIAFYSSQTFNNRISQIFDNYDNYYVEPATSIGLRMSFSINTINLFLENPILGIGTGDFPEEYVLENRKYIKANNFKYHESLFTVNPHNMYLYVLSLFGMFGGIVFLYFFYTLFKTASNVKNKSIKNAGFATIAFFLLINLGDTYLLGHFTTFLFIVFSSFLFKLETD